MRRVGLIKTAAEAKEVDEAVQQKFSVGPNPLEKERFLKVLEPTYAKQLERMVDLMEDYAAANDQPETRMAVELWRAQIAQGAFTDQVKLDFVKRFYFWLIGRGTDADTKRTAWGRTNVAVYNEQVRAYIDMFLDRRAQYATQLALLSERTPTTLLQFYLYFKYIVDGKLQYVKDTKGGYWDMGPEDYLDDFELFESEFQNELDKQTFGKQRESAIGENPNPRPSPGEAYRSLQTQQRTKDAATRFWHFLHPRRQIEPAPPSVQEEVIRADPAPLAAVTNDEHVAVEAANDLRGFNVDLQPVVDELRELRDEMEQERQTRAEDTQLQDALARLNATMERLAEGPQLQGLGDALERDFQEFGRALEQDVQRFEQGFNDMRDALQNLPRAIADALRAPQEELPPLEPIPQDRKEPPPGPTKEPDTTIDDEMPPLERDPTPKPPAGDGDTEDEDEGPPQPPKGGEAIKAEDAAIRERAAQLEEENARLQEELRALRERPPQDEAPTQPPQRGEDEAERQRYEEQIAAQNARIAQLEQEASEARINEEQARRRQEEAENVVRRTYGYTQQVKEEADKARTAAEQASQRQREAENAADQARERQAAAEEAARQRPADDPRMEELQRAATEAREAADRFEREAAEARTEADQARQRQEEAEEIPRRLHEYVTRLRQEAAQADEAARAAGQRQQEAEAAATAAQRRQEEAEAAARRPQDDTRVIELQRELQDAQITTERLQREVDRARIDVREANRREEEAEAVATRLHEYARKLEREKQPPRAEPDARVEVLEQQLHNANTLNERLVQAVTAPVAQPSPQQQIAEAVARGVQQGLRQEPQPKPKSKKPGKIRPAEELAEGMGGAKAPKVEETKRTMETEATQTIREKATKETETSSTVLEKATKEIEEIVVEAVQALEEVRGETEEDKETKRERESEQLERAGKRPAVEETVESAKEPPMPPREIGSSDTTPTLAPPPVKKPVTKKTSAVSPKTRRKRSPSLTEEEPKIAKPKAQTEAEVAVEEAVKARKKKQEAANIAKLQEEVAEEEAAEKRKEEERHAEALDSVKAALDDYYLEHEGAEVGPREEVDESVPAMYLETWAKRIRFAISKNRALPPQPKPKETKKQK